MLREGRRAGETPAVAALLPELESVYESLTASAADEMTALLESDDLSKVGAVLKKHEAFSADVEGTLSAVRVVLEQKMDDARSALREAAEGESFLHLSEVIERYAPHTRMLPSELRDAKQAKSALLSAAARELGGLAHAASRKHSTKPTATQIEEALAKYKAYPEAGSIGESIGTLRPLLPKRRKEEAERAERDAAAAAQEQKEKDRQAEKARKQKEEDDFWAEQERKEREAAEEQDRRWAEAAAAAEAKAAVEEAQRKEEAEARAAVELVAKLEASETAAAEAAEAAEARRKDEVRPTDRRSLCLRLC